MIHLEDKILKVCKIDSLIFASFAIKQNVNFLGIHVLEENNIGEHQELVEFIKANNGKPVIVTKIKDIDILKKIVALYEPAALQFHFEIQTQLTLTIRKLFPSLLLFGVFTNQSKVLDFDLISNLFDYLIYDTSFRGGTNEKNDYNHLNKFPDSLRKKTLLAGGITPNRIKELNSLQTCGYDIQSYFRTDAGLSFKNLDKVCDLTKFPRKNMLSISLTDLSLNEICKASSYYLNSNLEYHLDYSLGSLYPTFNTINNSIEEKQQFITQLPYSIHLFIKDENEILDKVNKLIKKYPLNLIRIFIQYFDGISKKIFEEPIADMKIIPSVLYKDLNSYFSQSINSQLLSIVVPNHENQSKIKIFFQTFLSFRNYFEGKEIWFDRNLDFNYIELLKKHLGKDFNFIIGKEVINDWSKINFIHEHLSK
jgi:phosphoribosylanthranilate isomerase